jgi:hypothetical protein
LHEAGVRDCNFARGQTVVKRTKDRIEYGRKRRPIRHRRPLSARRGDVLTSSVGLMAISPGMNAACARSPA